MAIGSGTNSGTYPRSILATTNPNANPIKVHTIAMPCHDHGRGGSLRDGEAKSINEA